MTLFPFRAPALALILTASAVAAPLTSAFADHLPALGAIAWGDHRAEGNRERNRYRHPVETLDFFGIEPDMTVVEVSPGGSGWYTEILAPYLRDNGKYYAAGYDPNAQSDYYRRSTGRFMEKLAAQPEIYDKVKRTVFELPDHSTFPNW